MNAPGGCAHAAPTLSLPFHSKPEGIAMHSKPLVMILVLTSAAVALATPAASAAIGDATDSQRSVCWVPTNTPLVE